MREAAASRNRLSLPSIERPQTCPPTTVINNARAVSPFGGSMRFAAVAAPPSHVTKISPWEQLMLWTQKPSDLSLLEVLGMQLQEAGSIESGKQRGGIANKSARSSAVTQKFTSVAAIDQMVSQVLALLDEKAREAEIDGWRAQAHSFEDVHPKEPLPTAPVVIDSTQHVRRNPLPKERLRERLAEFETNPHALFELNRRLREYRCAFVRVQPTGPLAAQP